MSELPEPRWIAVAAVVAIAAAWVLARWSARRRRGRFSALARAVGAEITAEGEFLFRFATRVGGRACEVRHQHLGGGGGAAGWTPDWYVVTLLELRGVSALHSVDIRPRSRRRHGSSPTAPDAFAVRDPGYPLRDGWLTPPVGSALASFFDGERDLGALLIEEGKLIHRSRFLLRRLDGPRLRALLERQAAVASELERVL